MARGGSFYMCAFCGERRRPLVEGTRYCSTDCLRRAAVAREILHALGRDGHATGWRKGRRSA